MKQKTKHPAQKSEYPHFPTENKDSPEKGFYSAHLSQLWTPFDIQDSLKVPTQYFSQKELIENKSVK